MNEPSKKPPLGIMPQELWDYQRRLDLRDAINRRMSVGKSIPLRWIAEYNDLAYKEEGGS